MTLASVHLGRRCCTPLRSCNIMAAPVKGNTPAGAPHALWRARTLHDLHFRTCSAFPPFFRVFVFFMFFLFFFFYIDVSCKTTVGECDRFEARGRHDKGGSLNELGMELWFA